MDTAFYKAGQSADGGVYINKAESNGAEIPAEHSNGEPSPRLRHSISSFLTSVKPIANQVNGNGCTLITGASKDGNMPLTTTPKYSPPWFSPSSDSGISSLSPPSSISPLYSSMYESRHISTPSLSPSSPTFISPMPAVPGLRELTKSLPSPTFSSALPMSSTMYQASTKHAQVNPATAFPVASTRLEDSATTLSSPPNRIKATKDVDKDRTKRSKRTNFTISQISKLQQLFEEEPYPDHDAMETIARDLRMTEKQVKIWFQNKRARHRRRAACSRINPHTQMIQAIPNYLPMTSFDQSIPNNITLTALPSLQSAMGFPVTSDQFKPDMKSQLGQWGHYYTNVGMNNEPQRFTQPWNPFWPVAAPTMSDTHALSRENYINMTNTQFTPRQTSWCVSPSYLRQGC